MYLSSLPAASERSPALAVSDYLDTVSRVHQRVRTRLKALLCHRPGENPAVIKEVSLRLDGAVYTSHHPEDFFVAMHARGLTYRDLDRAIDAHEQNAPLAAGRGSFASLHPGTPCGGSGRS